MTRGRHGVMQDSKHELQDAIQSATPEQLDLARGTRKECLQYTGSSLPSGQQQIVADTDAAERLIVQHG